jgi:hypothetical protein
LKDEEADESQQRMKKLVSPQDNSSSAAPTETSSPQ